MSEIELWWVRIQLTSGQLKPTLVVLGEGILRDRLRMVFNLKRLKYDLDGAIVISELTIHKNIHTIFLERSTAKTRDRSTRTRTPTRK